MESTWTSLLNELGLTDVERANARLTTIEEFQLGFPTKQQFLHLKTQITSLLQTVLAFTVITPGRTEITSENPFKRFVYYCHTVSLNNIESIKSLWLSEAGGYILFLSGSVAAEEFNFNMVSDEQFIGSILKKYRKIFLKTPDGDKLLYLELEGDFSK